jgi:hypothetical protein
MIINKKLFLPLDYHYQKVCDLLKMAIHSWIYSQDIGCP